MKLKALSIILLLFCFVWLPMASAEVYLWTDVDINDNTDTVSQHAYFQFEDTSKTGIGRHKDVEVILLYNVEGLPYNLTAVGYDGFVDECNLSIVHTKNTYSTEFTAFQGFSAGGLVNTTLEKSSVFFSGTGNATSGQLSFLLRDKDSITANMKCHYTNDTFLYVENILFGRFTTFLPAYECDGCEEFSLEELSEETQRNIEIAEEQNSAYNLVQVLVDKNFTLWIIALWLVKILFLLLAVASIFFVIYHLYRFIKDIEGQI